MPITPTGTLDLSQLEKVLTERTRLFCFVHVSNVVGTVNPVQQLVTAARAVGARVLIDAAQSVPHMPVDVQALDADFLVFSSHKMCGPTGIGVLYGKRELLESMPPFLGGGDMIREVTLQGSRWNTIPYKFEAGTPAIAEAIGLGAAVDYLTQVGMEWVHAHERALTAYAYARIAEVEGIQILGPGPEARGGLVAFTLKDVHPHDIAAILDRSGVAVWATTAPSPFTQSWGSRPAPGPVSICTTRWKRSTRWWQHCTKPANCLLDRRDRRCERRSLSRSNP